MADTHTLELPGDSVALRPALLEFIAEFNAHARSVKKSGSAGYRESEKFVATQMSGVARAAHKVLLGLLDIDSECVKIWGDVYKKVGRYEGEYFSLEGAVRVERSIYRKVGERNGRTVDPVSLRAGVVEDGWLPHAAQAMAHLVAKGTSREAQSTSNELQRLPYSRVSFERVAHAVGKLYCAAAPRIEEALIQSYQVPERAKSISVSVDRVSLPMEESPTKPAPKRDKKRVKMLDDFVRGLKVKHAVEPRTLAYIEYVKRAAKRRRPKVLRNWRMAYCATVTLHDAKGDALHTIRYGRMPAGDTRSLMRRLAADIRALRQKRSDLEVVFLADGAAELWALFDTYLSKQDIGIEGIRLLDCWHVMEYLAAAAPIVESKIKSWGQFRAWRKTILTEAKGSDQILKELRDSGAANVRDANGECPVQGAIRYLEKRLPMTRYATARRMGLPIGSGNVEATCKSLVGLRMKRSGARWKHTTGNEVLQLRALMLSDRWTNGIARALSPRAKPVWPVNTIAAQAA